ncbi:MAG TPA: hypothetical protein VHF27_08050 [Acidimicrobiales bacterium]|nr:hypothetical protein [Acidimicrobiales bacterium]
MTEPEFHYTWPTRLRPYPFLRACTPFKRTEGFRAAVEVVIFPERESAGYRVMTSRDYLANGAELDRGAAAVRFNTDTVLQVHAADQHQRRAEPFSVIWVPVTVPSDPQAVGQVHLIGPEWITEIMRDMVEESATPQVDVDSVLAHRDRLNGSEQQSLPHPRLTETGLVKSSSIPPGRLRVVSRLDDELLKGDTTLTHELVIAATVPPAVEEATDLECEIAVFPKGWVTMRSSSMGSPEDMVRLPVPANWRRPQEGRTGLGSRYVSETLVSRARVSLLINPPASRHPMGRRRGAEVRVRVLRHGVELCRLHHPFWIEPRAQGSESEAVTSAFPEELHRLLELLNAADVARATGVPLETVRAWLQDDGEPAGEEARRFKKLLDIVDRLTTVMNRDYIATWLRKSLQVLDGERPLDMLAHGDYEAVSRVVAALESPVAS